MKAAYAAICMMTAGALSGCSYKPLVAPCAHDEGGGPRIPIAREHVGEEGVPASPQGAVQTLYYAEPERSAAPEPFSSHPQASDCGALLPINAGALR